MSSTAKKKRAAAAAAAKPVAKPLPTVQIPVDQIDPSPANRNAKIDIAALAASIKEVGLQQPIKVRPKGTRYEIVYGERRWRAVKHLKLDSIAATVEDLDDVGAAEVRAIENLQRKDPHPLEEAEEYERLLALRDSKGKPLHTPESIAKVIAGRSVSHVYQRLKLTALAPELRAAVYKDELSVAGAFAIARGIPTELQAEAWAKMKEYQTDEAYEEELDDAKRLTARVIQNIIDHEYTTRLESAPFSVKDAKLVPAAGSCEKCPQRSRNQPFLFEDKERPDSCANLTCFRAKVAAYIEREKQRVLDVGGKLLSEEESRRVFNGGSHLAYNSKWIDLDQVSHDDPERRTWRTFLGDLCPPPTLAFTSQSKPVLLAEKQAILDTLKAHGLDPDSLRKKVTAAPRVGAADVQGARPAHHDDPATDDDGAGDEDVEAGAPQPEQSPTDQRFDADVARLSRHAILGAVVAAIEASGPQDNRFVQLVYETTLRGGYHNAIADTVKRRLGSKRPKGEQPVSALEEHGATLTAQGLRALVVELALGRSSYYVVGATNYSRDLQRAIELYQIDTAALEAQVTEDLRAKRAARLSRARAGSA